MKMKETTQCPPRKEMFHECIVKQSVEICKPLNHLRFRKILSDERFFPFKDEVGRF